MAADMSKIRLARNLKNETTKRLVAKLEEIVKAMNRRAKLGMARDTALGEYLSLELRATQIGNEIKSRNQPLTPGDRHTLTGERAMTTYTAKIFGDEYQIAADFSQASCPVHGDGHGRQVADFRHSPRAAMESLLRETVEMSGDDPDDFDDEIDEALDSMTDSDSIE